MFESAPKVKSDSISVEGLDDVFDLEPITGTGTEPVPGTQAQVTGTSEPVTQDLAPVPNHSLVPVEEAALALGSSVNALKKRLRRGTLSGFKYETKHGEKWFVNFSEPDNQEPVTGTCATKTKGTPAPVTRAALELQHSAFEPKSADIYSNIEILHRLTTSLEKKDTVIENQAHQLKAAGDVIMYLRNELENKETELKLLTDSQHKNSWWTRFLTWFKA